jgi:hypothetical protein
MRSKWDAPGVHLKSGLVYFSRGCAEEQPLKLVAYREACVGLIQSLGSTQENGKRTTVRKWRRLFFLSFYRWWKGGCLLLTWEKGEPVRIRDDNFWWAGWGSLRRTFKIRILEGHGEGHIRKLLLL